MSHSAINEETGSEEITDFPKGDSTLRPELEHRASDMAAHAFVSLAHSFVIPCILELL